jgi:hypothetical protein
MKQFAKVLGIASIALLGLSVYGDDRTFDGGPTNKWEGGANWGGAVDSNCPGGVTATGTFNRPFDRAIINQNNGETGYETAVFDSSSGANDCQCRSVHELIINASATNPAANLGLQVTGDRLNVRDLYMTSGSSSSQQATLQVTAANSFYPINMNLVGTSSSHVSLDFDQDVHASGRVYMQGYVDIDLAAGMTFAADQLVIEGPTSAGDTVIAKAGTGVFSTN